MGKTEHICFLFSPSYFLKSASKKREVSTVTFTLSLLYHPHSPKPPLPPPHPPPPLRECQRQPFPTGGFRKAKVTDTSGWPQGGMCRRVHVSTNSQKAELGVPVSKYGSTSCVSHGRWHTSPAGCGSLPLLERPLRNENENSPENLPECDSLRRKASRSRELRYAKLNIT